MTYLRGEQIRRALPWAALALFVVSMFLPAVADGGQCLKPDWGTGFDYFLTGPLGPFHGQFGWLANPLMLFALLKTNRIAAVLSVGLVVLTAFTLRSVPMIEPGNLPVCGFGSGYYAWLACAVLISITTFTKSAERI
jgi:hypothetical protein